MAKATMQIVGPGGVQYIADRASLGRMLQGDARRVRVYHDDGRRAKGRPVAKLRRDQIQGLEALGLAALIERHQKEGADHA